MVRRGLVFAHSSDELYGADRMLLEILAALSHDERGEVWLPTDLEHPLNRLCVEVEQAGTPTRHLPLPILRRAYRTPRGLLVLAVRAARLLATLLRRRPATLYCTTDMEGLFVKGQGEAPVRISLGGRLVACRGVGGERVVGDARSD